MKKLLALLLLSPLLSAESETYTCNCESFFNTKDFLVKDCPGNPKSYGLIINFNEKTMSFENKKYYYKDNPNTLSGRNFERIKGNNGELRSDMVYEIEFEKVTKALNVEILDIKNSLSYIQIFSCSSSN